MTGMNRLPPGPSGGPFTTLSMMRDPYGAAVRWSKRYGDPFSMKLPMRGPLVITGDPEAVRTIFAADPAVFGSAAADSMAPIIGQSSVLVLEGQAHLRARKLLMPPFHGARMRGYGTLMRDVTRARTAHLSAGTRFTVQDLAQTISLDVILQAVFGVREPERMAQLDAAVRGWMASLGPFIAMFEFLRHEFGGVGPWAKFQRARRTLAALLDVEIAERKADGVERTDVLSLMLAARYDDGSAMTNAEIFDQMVTLVAAGHETSKISLAWACYWLHRNPDVLEKLLAELDGDADSYLEAVIQETLRLYPIVAVATRKLAQPFELKGYSLPAGCHVGAGTSLIHYREDLYPEPERFYPDRFLGRTFGASEYFPFGGGARRCIGAAFAMYELKRVLGTLLRSVRMKPADDKAVRPALGAAGIGQGRGVEMVVVERR